MTAWKVNDETTKRGVNRPPKTEHEKKALEDAEKEVAKEVLESARGEYAEDLREILKKVTQARELETEITKALKALGMTREQVNKLI